MARKKSDDVQDVKAERMGPLTLTGLKVENVLRIRIVDLKFKPGEAVILEGNNEQGKSSVLRALEILLAGMGETPDEPIHGDAKEGEIIATFGDIVVTKTFSRGRSPQLRVHRNGKRQTAPQTLLNELLNMISLRPLDFFEADNAKRFSILSSIMGFDPAPFDLQADKLYRGRRDANRDVKRLQIELDAVTIHDDAPDAEVSVAELTADLKERQAHNTTIRHKSSEVDVLQNKVLSAQEDVETTASELKTTLEKIDELKKSAAKLRESQAAFEDIAESIETDYRGAKTELEAMVPADEDEITAQMENVEELNRKFRENRSANTLSKKLSEAEEVAATLGEELATVESSREAARLKARENLPVKELDITKDQVLYKGKPMDQAGSSAELRVSVAVALAVNEDAKVKLLLIDDAEKLDPANTELVLTMAKEAGFQVMMARVGDGTKATVLIEDGEAVKPIE